MVSSEVVFANEGAGVRLAGTLTLPNSARPCPAVLLVTGSGPQDRDETVLSHKPFLAIAEHLTRRGFAVLRYDDRGVGGSTGDFASATTEDFAGDAAAGVAFLRGRSEIDPRRIGILGHSEGALVEAQVLWLEKSYRWLRFFLVYDPSSTLRRVSCPVLALGGEKDLQVPAAENLAAIERALLAGGNTQVTTAALPLHNHLFQRCVTGLPGEYAGIAHPIPLLVALTLVVGTAPAPPMLDTVRGLP